MKIVYVIITGLILGMLESSIGFSIGPYQIHFSFVVIGALCLFFTGSNNKATVLLIAGAMVIDLFSPIRAGVYLLSYAILLGFVQFLMARSYETSNPVIGLWIIAVCLIVVYVFEFLNTFSGGTLILNLLFNTLLGIAIGQIYIRTAPQSRSRILVSDDVHFRGF